MRKVLLIILVCSFSSLAYTQTKDDFLKFTNSALKYEISYPKEWTTKKNNNDVFLYAPPENPTDTWSENILLSVSSNNGLNLKEIYENYIEGGVAYMDKFKKIDAGEEIIDSKKYKWILFSSVGNKQGQELVNLIYLTSHKDKMYIITSTLHPTNYSKYIPQCKRIIKTFKVL